MTILNTRAFRVQMLAKLCGMRIDCLAQGLGAEPKPTAKVLLSEMEQTLLNAVAENIGHIKANAAMREAALLDQLEQANAEAAAARRMTEQAEFDLAVQTRRLENARLRLKQLEQHQARPWWQRLVRA